MKQVNMMKGRGVVILSGGLDSSTALCIAKKTLDEVIALTFDYGQSAAKNEIKASKKICETLKVKHYVIRLPYFSMFRKRVNLLSNKIPCVTNIDQCSLNTAVAVWVPNRNGVFANIGASFCDALGFNWVIMGFNKEEATTFPDNSEGFISAMNQVWEYSTQVKPKLWAPLIDKTKPEIVHTALKEGLDLSMVWACYRGGRRHCGVCESCVRFKNALQVAGVFDRFRRIFGR
jgi:7-cyano-7-deazaguanine synthase